MKEKWPIICLSDPEANATESVKNAILFKRDKANKKMASHQYSQSGKIQRAEIDGAATLPWSGFHASRHYVTAGGYVYMVCVLCPLNL